MAKVWTRSFFCHCLRSHTWWHSEKLLSQLDMDQGPDSYSLTWCWKSFSIEELIHCLPFCSGTLIAAISVKVLLYNFYASVKKLSASQHTGHQTFTMSRYFRLTPSLALAMCLGRQAYAAYAAYAAFAACAAYAWNDRVWMLQHGISQVGVLWNPALFGLWSLCSHVTRFHFPALWWV